MLKNKIAQKVLASLGVAAAVLLPLAPMVAAAQTPFSTTTLGTAIDSVSGTSYDYFTVLIAKFWPYLLGAVLLVGVIAFGKRIVHSMWGK